MITSDSSGTAEIYDPVADTFSTRTLPTVHYFGQRIVRLRDGRIMIMGGDGCGTGTCTIAQNDVAIYDPKTDKLTAAKPMNFGRTQFTAHVLPDGRVMVFGGASVSAGGVQNPMDSIEAYDPTNDTWTTQTYKLLVPRTWHASALVRDGTILVMGGYTQNGSCAPSDKVDQVDPVAGTVVPFGTLPDPNTEWNAVTMLDGSVLGVGGGACGGNALPDLDFLPGAPGPN
jgi:N-acetylneuraminic acid mutarotase